MNQTPPPTDATPDPTPVSLRDALEERYLSYALSTIMNAQRNGARPYT